MKIAFFFEIFYPEINGVITSTVNLALNLVEIGHEVIFIAPKVMGFRDEFIHGKIRVLYLSSIPSAIYPGLRLSPPIDIILSNKLRKEKIDIVHITGPFTVGLFGLNFAKLHRLPLVHTFHTMINEPSYLKYFFKKDKLVEFGSKMVINYIKPFIKSSDVITAPTKYVKDFIVKTFPKTEVIQISNGIDIEIFKTYDSFEVLNKRYPKYNRKSFIFVGRVGYEKSVDIIIKAFQQAVQKDKELQLFIVGSGPKIKDFTDLVAKLDIHSNIHFLGKMDQAMLIKSGLLQHARAFITASKTETQCMTVMEAIIAGIPIIIPDVDGINELFDDNGRLFEADNIEELSQHILDIDQDDSLYKAFCQKSVNFKDKFDGRLVAGTFEKLYQEQIEKKRLKRRKV